eukprot:TRINITY_DN1058_c0_g2_i4.p1 TRINITY_DN1058_c0_g2~~TRINITY_DN1058_c0_g2_i4.p1  ORF type:complete len:537 (+),score=273.55 TRINITY_DN1058_c0_g2_i4:1275-2885(+)
MYVESSCDELVQLANGITVDADELLDEMPEDEPDRQPIIDHVDALAQLVQELEELKTTKKPGDENYPEMVDEIQTELLQLLTGLYQQIAKQRKRDADAGGAKRGALRKAFSKAKTLQQDVIKLVKKLAKEKDGPAKKKLSGDFNKLALELKASRDKVSELRQRSEHKRKRIAAFRKRKQRKAREAARLRKLDMYEQMSEALRLEKEQLQRERETASRKWHEFKRNMTQAGRAKGHLLKSSKSTASLASSSAAASAAGMQPSPSAAASASADAAVGVVPGGDGAGTGAGADAAAAAAAGPHEPAAAADAVPPDATASSAEAGNAVDAAEAAAAGPASHFAIALGEASSADHTPASPPQQLRKQHSLPLHQSPLGALLPDKSAMMTSRFRTLDKEGSEKRDALLQSLPRVAPASQLQPLSGTAMSRSPSNASSSGPAPSFNGSPSLASSASFNGFASPASSGPGMARAASVASVNSFDKHLQLKPMAIGKPIAPPLTNEQLAEQQRRLDRERIQAAHRKQLEALKRKALEAQQNVDYN